jgi:hypothetical protein
MIEPGKPLSLERLMGTLASSVEKAEQERDKIATDAGEAEQKNWFFFNGKVTALHELEAQLRMWLKSFPIPACIDWLKSFPMPDCIDLPNPGEVNVKLSNGETVSLREDRDCLHVGQVDGVGEDWWLCTIQKNGVLVAPNSSNSCEVLAHKLKNHDPLGAEA